MLYTILCYKDEDVVTAWSAEEDAAIMGRLGRVHEALERRGKLGPSLRLLPTTAATTLRKASEPPLVIDGPFAETKEPLLGLYVVDVVDLDEAGRTQHAAREERTGMSSTNQPDAPAPVKGGLVAYLTVDGAMRAADFYVRAFGAEIVTAMPADEHGRTMHVHLYVNGSSLMLGDAYPEHGHALQAPQAFNLTLMVDGIDARYAQAVEAGATPLMPPSDMFWGDRYGQLRDPFGVLWAMNQQAR